MKIITEARILDTENATHNFPSINYKRICLNFTAHNSTRCILLEAVSETSNTSIQYAIYTGNNLLINENDNAILAIQYSKMDSIKHPFFNKGAYVIRLNESFVTDYKYKSLFSSFKSNVLKPFIAKGGLIEIVPTNSDMVKGTTHVLNIPDFESISDYKVFCDSQILKLKT